MTRLRYFLVLGIFAAIVAVSPGLSGALLAQDASEIQYETLSPWAEVDPVPLRGISPRIDSLAGKKIGLFANYKRAAMPIAEALQRRLESKYPDSTVTLYHSNRWNVTEFETDNREKFTEWAEGVDAAILVVGD